jgi:hypothetical protein
MAMLRSAASKAMRVGRATVFLIPHPSHPVRSISGGHVTGERRAAKEK